ncbi:hypothetical protein AABH71_003149 [Salmonella enterica]|uniref:Uncharacterized protein n=1 Tax=Salmonella enterica I TaxID=59201 RepID=A0A403QK40_SALET|nr:hypothetical protein [Salmonella enterica subsp. enterica serovar Kokomlemle]EEB7409767.1 hypothetical protein [Salmonella enterica]EGJ5834692.1 hypothetical protein [Salmonella enterica]MML55209.1 hypothetical protein [Salmonella enterica subsp. enterica serovar Kidderminster]
MTLLKKVQATASEINNITTSLLGKKSKLETQIAEKNDAIKNLLDMPMSIDDFCSFIPEYVRIRGESYYSRFSYENREKKLKPWGGIESENGYIDTGYFYISGEGGNYFSDVNIASFARECFFHPENTAKRLTDKLKSELADSWGNEQFPPIAERRATIKKLQAEREAVQSELDEVNDNIEAIYKATAQITQSHGADTDEEN